MIKVSCERNRSRLPDRLAIAILALGFSCTIRGASDRPAPRVPDPKNPLDVVQGPILLHSNIELQWGGQAFDYLLQGDRGAFWTAKLFDPGTEASPALIGQFPGPESALEAHVTTLAIDRPNLVRVFQPLMVRSPDGYLHVFVGYEIGERSHGQVAYFRSRDPEDVRQLIDRSELMPAGRFAAFHNRQNVALSRDGRRIALAILSSFEPGRHPINVPLIWLGERDGLDYRFREPVEYGEPMSFFYPMLAVTEEGIVIVGSVTNEDNSRRDALLVHLDASGRVLHREDFPRPEDPGEYAACDIQPIDPTDWSHLAIVRPKIPKSGSSRSIEFWEYDARERRLSLRRTRTVDVERERSITNAGKMLAASGRAPLFVNNPASGGIAVWGGDLFGAGEVRLSDLPRTKPSAIGYIRSRSVFVPKVSQGSIGTGDFAFIAADVTGAGMREGERGPCGFLLWIVRRGDGRRR